MTLTIHTLIAALESADVWDTRMIDARPEAETIATLREYAWGLALDRVCERDDARLRSSDDAPLTRRT